MDALPFVRISDPVNVDLLLIEGIYNGFGRIAGHGMVQASWTPIQFIVFSNNMNLIAIRWIRLQDHCLFFNRVQFKEDEKKGLICIEH